MENNSNFIVIKFFNTSLFDNVRIFVKAGAASIIEKAKLFTRNDYNIIYDMMLKLYDDKES